MKDQQPIAVVGMAGLFPGAADLTTFWENMIQKIGASGDVLPARWIADPEEMIASQPRPDKAFSRRCCLIRDFHFNSNGFEVPPEVLSKLDPVHQLALAVGRTALTKPKTLSFNRETTGVVLAAIALPTDAASTVTRELFRSTYEQNLFGMTDYHPPTFEQGLAARVTGLPAAILAMGLGLGGGSYTLDAACASSIYAVKLACDMLQSHRVDTMLAGGVSRPECLYTQVGFSQLRALSPSGRCAPFDARADGLVVGEGAGIMVLKRLADAVKQGDTIYGVIRGIGLSNDMRGNLLAPDSEGQLRAMTDAYEAADWAPTDIDLIECHGAGTPVGDATELGSLRSLWRQSDWRVSQCPIGSVKSMIGHLLTAAGAAGMIKTLLAINHRMLPPSLNFQGPPENSPLIDGPFRVQTEAEEWLPRDRRTPRRAAVSAFGFGGINAHLLIEEWRPEGRIFHFPKSQKTVRASEVKAPVAWPEPKGQGGKRMPMAIIGMATQFGRIQSLAEFQETILGGRSIITKRPDHRWKGCDEVIAPHFGLSSLPGGFMDALDVDLNDFRIPPKEIPEILPQHLLLLKVAAAAMTDADLPIRHERPRMGAIIGLEFDYEATNFHFRWALSRLVNAWQTRHRIDLEDTDPQQWLNVLKDSASPPLTADRTLGALGGIVASRVAREFRFGGPSFAVSCEEASGLHAIDIAIQMLARNEQDAVLVGTVDLFGDLRRLINREALRSFSSTGQIRPFDAGADGTLPGEGAAALVLKPLAKALADGHTIYAVVRGIGHSGAGWQTNAAPCLETHQRALMRALQDAAAPPETIGYYEAHGSADPAEDRIEAQALSTVFKDMPHRLAVGTLKPNIGHSGAAAGLAAVIKTALCLFHETLPPQSFGPLSPRVSLLDGSFEMSSGDHPWPADEPILPRRACVAALTPDGNSSVAILEGAESCVAMPPKQKTKRAGRVSTPQPHQAQAAIRVPVGGPMLQPSRAKQWMTRHASPSEQDHSSLDRQHVTVKTTANPSARIPDTVPQVPQPMAQADSPHGLSANYEEMTRLENSSKATARAHQTFLTFSQEATRSFRDAFELQTKLYRHLIHRNPAGINDASPFAPLRPADSPPADAPTDAGAQVAFDRNQCLEFALGRIANVLGPEFAEVDGYKTRVRLPGEPLMLVDRILKVKGRMRSLSSGRIVTEHDVRPGAWYLDGNRAPVSIAVEAGQADLFLCAYLGIDLAVKGERVYRLLDASVVFHRGLPNPGETIRYEIEIEKFIRQGPTYLFFFNFKGLIGDQLLIRMTDGCAGFFTEEEIRHSGGIVRSENVPPHSIEPPLKDRCDLVPMVAESYDAAAVDALRQGDLEACFGPAFAGISMAEALRLPGGRLKLIDRIRVLEPSGGAYGLGLIQAEADIHPDDWFLTCHFIDDMTMPGTLMYECCAHTLRIFLQRMGWISNQPDVRYEPVLGTKSVLKCRGPVTPQTRKVIYEVEVKEMGWTPEPYVIADAHMYADGRYIVQFKDMSMKMTGSTRQALESFWAANRSDRSDAAPPRPLFDRKDILAFAVGQPSQAFGAPYEPFDAQRFIARLPGPPYSFIDRVVAIEPQPWELQPDGWIEAEFDVRPEHWYFRADRSGIVPYCVPLEIALQSCGWLAAYMGSALKSKTDLRFRNLDGQGLLYHNIQQQEQTLRVRCRLKKASVAGDTIIETFEYGIFRGGQAIYEGATSFGFFTTEALSQQKGIAETSGTSFASEPIDSAEAQPFVFDEEAPLTPEDPRSDSADALAMPSKALRMIDRIERFIPHGGRHGLGFIRGIKRVDPHEWFFKAHFFQDPVCPGSLGIESFLQLLKYVALQRWNEKIRTHMFTYLTQAEHRWKYRGQILPTNRQITVDAEITDIRDDRQLEIWADGVLRVDGLCIYEMHNFGIGLVKRETGLDMA